MIDMNRHVEIALKLLEPLDCSLALSISMMVRAGLWDDIANLRISPGDYVESESFFRNYQAVRLLSKASWLPTTFDKKKVAQRKFEEAEEQCLVTNHRWRAYRLPRETSLKREDTFRDFEQIIHSARRKIGKVLGDDLWRWTELCDFGPGADGSTEAGMTSAYNKLKSPGDITFGAYPFLNVFSEITSLGYLLKGDPETRMLDISISRGNSVTFVPKNAKTDRPIAVEPRWNMFFQKGLGRYLRKRLKLFGVNLDFQGLNQALAVYGSYTGKYGTIDLASASDTVSKELVLALLPEPWLTIFAALRSPAYLLDGEWKGYQKWSSMGNGYTFELESLLFWALASSVDEDVAVYGDDLIVPSSAYDTVVRVLNLCGFTVNTEKSYVNGPFRESCGTDAFLGNTVTPIYWKDQLDDQGTLSLVNQISVLATRLAPEGYRLKDYRKVWKDLVYQLPKRLQTRGPTTISSTVHDCSAEWKAVRKFDGTHNGTYINIYVPQPRRFRYSNFDAAVVSQNFQPSSDGYIVRDRWSWRKETVFIPCGYADIGPWGP